MKNIHPSNLLEGADFADRLSIRIVGPHVKYVPNTVNVRNIGLGPFSISCMLALRIILDILSNPGMSYHTWAS